MARSSWFKAVDTLPRRFSNQTYELENAAVVRQAFARYVKAHSALRRNSDTHCKIRRAGEVCLTRSGPERALRRPQPQPNRDDEGCGTWRGCNSKS